MCRNLYSLTLEPREVHLHKGHLLQKSCADVTLRWKMKMYFLVNKKKNTLQPWRTGRVVFHSSRSVSRTEFAPFQVSVPLNNCLDQLQFFLTHFCFLTLRNPRHGIYSPCRWFMKIILSQQAKGQCHLLTTIFRLTVSGPENNMIQS